MAKSGKNKCSRERVPEIAKPSVERISTSNLQDAILELETIKTHQLQGLLPMCVQWLQSEIDMLSKSTTPSSTENSGATFPEAVAENPAEDAESSPDDSSSQAPERQCVEEEHAAEVVVSSSTPSEVPAAPLSGDCESIASTVFELEETSALSEDASKPEADSACSKPKSVAGEDEAVQEQEEQQPGKQSENTKSSMKIRIPTEEYPGYNFIGRLLGPRGVTLKILQQKSSCRLYIRGRGSLRFKDIAQEQLKANVPGYEHLREDLHVLIEYDGPAENKQASFALAESMVKELLVPPQSDDQDELKKNQLKELAILNGTYQNANLPTTLTHLLTTCVQENKTLHSFTNKRIQNGPPTNPPPIQPSQPQMQGFPPHPQQFNFDNHAAQNNQNAVFGQMHHNRPVPPIMAHQKPNMHQNRLPHQAPPMPPSNFNNGFDGSGDGYGADFQHRMMHNNMNMNMNMQQQQQPHNMDSWAAPQGQCGNFGPGMNNNFFQGERGGFAGGAYPNGGGIGMQQMNNNNNGKQQQNHRGRDNNSTALQPTSSAFLPTWAQEFKPDASECAQPSIPVQPAEANAKLRYPLWVPPPVSLQRAIQQESWPEFGRTKSFQDNLSDENIAPSWERSVSAPLYEKSHLGTPVINRTNSNGSRPVPASPSFLETVSPTIGTNNIRGKGLGEDSQRLTFGDISNEKDGWGGFGIRPFEMLPENSSTGFAKGDTVQKTSPILSRRWHPYARSPPKEQVVQTSCAIDMPRFASGFGRTVSGGYRLF